MRKLVRQTTLAAIVVAPGAPLPTEFRLFALGENPTSKGVFTLTPESAAACMAAYQQAGVRLMIDLNHDSLDAPIRADSGDARGWFSLEFRPGDGIHAVNVNWTPDGERRLRERTQAYISPAFYDEEGVVFEICNAALCAMPATFDAPALVAASKRSPLVLAALVRANRSPLVLAALARARRTLRTLR